MRIRSAGHFPRLPRTGAAPARSYERHRDRARYHSHGGPGRVRGRLPHGKRQLTYHLRADTAAAARDDSLRLVEDAGQFRILLHFPGPRDAAAQVKLAAPDLHPHLLRSPRPLRAAHDAVSTRLLELSPHPFHPLTTLLLPRPRSHRRLEHSPGRPVRLGPQFHQIVLYACPDLVNYCVSANAVRWYYQ